MLTINFALDHLPEFLIPPNFNLNPEIMFLILLISLLLLRFLMTYTTPCKVYLLDFTCYKPPITQKCTKERFLRQAGLFSSGDTLDFMKNALERSGLGEATYFPEAFLKPTFSPCMKDAKREVEMAVFGSIDMLLEKTGVRCEDIGIVVANCCIFNTVPSLSSMIVNRYRFKENIISYNLSGMGCSAGLIAIGLTKQLLQVHRNSYALVVSTESISENCYFGEEHSKLFINCVFRVGGAAMLLSNRPSDHRISKYDLIHTVHTNTASSDRSYSCIVHEEDDAGKIGITVTKDLLAAATTAIQSNLTTLGYLILPASEKLLFVTNYIARKLNPSENNRAYVPNYSKAVDHFLSHVGGKPVLDQLQRNLGFSDADMEASRMTLYRFGNTSSSSIWYELAYAEAKGRVKKGDRVWQLAFGSGFKCTSVVWRATKSVDYDETNPWTDEIDGFPVDLDNGGGSIPYFIESSKSRISEKSKV